MISMPAVFVQFSFMAKSLLILWPLVWVLWGCDEPQPAAQPAANRKTAVTTVEQPTTPVVQPTTPTVTYTAAQPAANRQTAVNTVVQPTTPTVTYKYLKDPPPELNSDAFPPDFDYKAEEQAIVVEELKRKYSTDIKGHTHIPRFLVFSGDSNGITGAAVMIKKVESVWKVWQELSPVGQSAAKKIARSIQNVVYDWVGQHFQFDSDIDNAIFVRALSKWLEPLDSCQILVFHAYDFAGMCKFEPKNSTLFNPEPSNGLQSAKIDIANRFWHDSKNYAFPEDLEKRLPSGGKDGFCSEFNRKAVEEAIVMWDGSYLTVFTPDVVQNLKQLIDKEMKDENGKDKFLISKIKENLWIDDSGPPKRIADLREFLWPTPAGTGGRLGFFLLLIASVALVVLLRSAQLPMRAQYTEIDLTSSLQSVL